LDDGVDGERALFTTQTREATDELINALVRARNSAYPDAENLSTAPNSFIGGASATTESPYLADADLEPPLAAAEPPYAAWRERFGIDGSVTTDKPIFGSTWDHPVVSWPGVAKVLAPEDPQPAPAPQSEQQQRQAALRRVIDRELLQMDYEGV